MSRSARQARALIILLALVTLTVIVWNFAHPVSGCAINPNTGEVWGTVAGQICQR